MNTQQMTISLVVIMLVVLGALLYLAMLGNVIAVALLFALWSIGCLALGWLLSFTQYRAQANNEEESFIANAKENMALMGTMQSVQNQQNTTLMRQLSQAARLPDPGNGDNGLLIDATIFDELD